jgi:putrescine transport system substrate-binding protein
MSNPAPRRKHPPAPATILPLLAALLAVGCGGPKPDRGGGADAASKAQDNVVNLYIWADYLSPATLAEFERETGISVKVSHFENLEMLESRILTGHSGFDVVVPTGVFLPRQIRSGAYLALDKSKLPGLSNLDPAIVSQLAVYDPGNAYAVPYMWGTVGIGYDEKRLGQVLPDEPRDSSRLLFEPEIAAKSAKCGINIMDDPVAVVRVVLRYLGRNSDAPSAGDLIAVEHALGRIRPYVRNIDTSGNIEALANGDVCVALTYNGDVVQARKRARESGNGVSIGFALPKEGTFLWFDTLAIPKDAPHVANAYRLIDYLLRPPVAAKISNAIGFANANAAATSMLEASVASDPAIYPRPDQKSRLFVPLEPSSDDIRAITRLWQKFKTGQ